MRRETEQGKKLMLFFIFARGVYINLFWVNSICHWKEEEEKWEKNFFYFASLQVSKHFVWKEIIFQWQENVTYVCRIHRDRLTSQEFTNTHTTNRLIRIKCDTKEPENKKVNKNKESRNKFSLHCALCMYADIRWDSSLHAQL